MVCNALDQNSRGRDNIDSRIVSIRTRLKTGAWVSVRPAKLFLVCCPKPSPSPDRIEVRPAIFLVIRYARLVARH